MRTLPRGILKGFKDSILEGNLAGLLRGSAIIAGLMITSLGYLYGWLTARPKVTKASVLKLS
jgi:hypothetical protein